MTDNSSNSPNQPSAKEAEQIAGRDENTSAVVNTSDSKAFSDCDWQDLFPFEQPYPQQVEAVEEFLDVLSDNGFYAVEGACGTGKTLIALVSGLYVIRNDSVTVTGSRRSLPEYDRIVGVTPVKQQLTQFVEEIRAINANLPADIEPAQGLVLRGMTDLMAYARADNLNFEAELSQRLEQASSDNSDIATVGSFRQQVSAIRQTARDLIKEGSPVDLEWDVQPETCTVNNCRKLTRLGETTRCPFHQYADDDDDGPWYDEVRAERISELIANLSGTRLEVAGTTTPYPAELPTVRDVMPFQDTEAAVSPDDPFDPFYARAVAGNMTVEFGHGAQHVLDGEALVSLAAAEGFCPHTTMSRLMSEAEIIIGNYNHLFDPDTRVLTKEKAGILDRNTLAVVDEAHMVEEKTREMLSYEGSVYTFQWARNDVQQAFELANGIVGPNSNEKAGEAKETAREILSDSPAYVTRGALEETLEFLDWAMSTVDDIVIDYLSAEYENWPSAIGDGRPPSDSVDLQEPGTVERDEFTQRLRNSEFDESDCEQLPAIADAVIDIHREIDISDRETAVDEVAELFYRWVTEGNTEYFRELQIEHSPHQNPGQTLPDWCERLNATLHIYNCIPNHSIGQIYDELGGGITMSATLEPMAAYRQAAGLQQLADGTSEPLSDTAPDNDATEISGSNFQGGRRVDDATYGLAFPEENRASWTVKLPKYTYNNRGTPTQSYAEMEPIRQQYADALTTVATSPGNILIGMPNYSEAKWAAALLEAETDQTIYHDESSTDEETTALLHEFFDTGGVLITSSLGTVTEGVDYDGAKLHTAAVVGVPFKNTQSKRTEAVIEAYDQGMSDSWSGFDLAVGIPAVRKARQVIGRVLRAPEEVGTRLFLDERYSQTGPYNVGQYLSDQEFDEFKTVSPDMLDLAFQQFWESHELTPAKTADQQKSSRGSASQSDGNEESRTSEMETTTENNNPTATSKIYLGAGANLGGWIALPRQVIRNEIIPLIENNRVDEDEESINVNFTSEIEMSGWNHVAPDTVVEDIEPLVKTHRQDSAPTTDTGTESSANQSTSKSNDEQNGTGDTEKTGPDTDSDEQLVRCPIMGCEYTGTISQVIPHYSYKSDPDHQDLAIVECPVKGCDYSGPLDSVGGHITGKRDAKHNPVILLRLPEFERVNS